LGSTAPPRATRPARCSGVARPPAARIRVRFVPNPQSGSSVVSTQNYVHQISSFARSDDPQAPGETVFDVIQADAAGAATGPSDGFSLVIF
jgi:hypothetical protein